MCASKNECVTVKVNDKKKKSLFEIVKMGILACEICPKMTFLGPGPTLGPP